jgi:chromosome partitioning protein
MHTISVVNEKGGTGKTTTAVNLSAALGEMGHKVLLVDLDGQAASSRWLGVEEDTSFADALYVGKGLKPLPDVMPNVSLAPASGKLDAVAHDLRPTQGGQLRKLLAEVANQFEFVIIDCPPSLGNRLIGNALIASTHAIVPVETSILALDGLKILLTTLDDVRDGFGHEIILAGVVACRFDSRTRLSRLVLAELKRSLPGRVFETVIRENVRMRECPASGQSILTYASDSHAAEDYRQLAQELVTSPWLNCQVQDQSDAAGTAAFFAAEKDMRIGDSLRQTVRKATKDAAVADADASTWKKRLEEAHRRLAAEGGLPPDAATEVEAPAPEVENAQPEADVEVAAAAQPDVPDAPETSVQDSTAVQEQEAAVEPELEPATRSAAELDPEAIRREVEALAADFGGENDTVSEPAPLVIPDEPSTAVAADVPPLENPATDGWQQTKVEADAPQAAEAPDEPKWDQPATEAGLVAAPAASKEPQPVWNQPASAAAASSVPAGEAASGDAAWLDLITGANTTPANPAPTDAPANKPVAPTAPEPAAPEPAATNTDWTLDQETPAEPASTEPADCPNLRRYLDELKQKQGDPKAPDGAAAKESTPHKGLLGRFFARSR